MSQQRAKGTAYENRVRDYLCAAGFPVRRTEFSSPDGDLTPTRDCRLLSEFVLECKNQREQRIGYWLDQAHRAAERLGRAFPVAIHNRRLKGIRQSYVTMQLDTFVALLRRIP